VTSPFATVCSFQYNLGRIDALQRNGFHFPILAFKAEPDYVNNLISGRAHRHNCMPTIHVEFPISKLGPQ